MDTGGSHTKRNQPDRGRQEHVMSPSRQNLERDTKELNHNTKIDSENPNTRIKKIKIKKGEAKELIRRLGITHTQIFMSILDIPQGAGNQHRKLC